MTKDTFLLLHSPVISLRFTTLVSCLCMWPFVNSTIEVVTFCLRGWCMLGVFFVATIHPSRTWMSGSESVRWNACVHRPDLGLYSCPKDFGVNKARSRVNSKEKVLLSGKSFSGEDWTHDAASPRVANPTHYQLSYSGPWPRIWLARHRFNVYVFR